MSDRLLEAREVLEALGLVDVDESGSRLALSSPTAEDCRDGSVLPVPIATQTRLGEVVSGVSTVLLPVEEHADPGSCGPRTRRGRRPDGRRSTVDGRSSRPSGDPVTR